VTNSLCNKSSWCNSSIVILFESNKSSIIRDQSITFDRIAREMSFSEFRSRYIIANFSLCRVDFMIQSTRAHFLIILSVCSSSSLKTEELNFHRFVIWFMTSSINFWKSRVCRIINIMTKYSFSKSLNSLCNFVHESFFFIQNYISSTTFFMRKILCVQ
jgi:hypothetical protein